MAAEENSKKEVNKGPIQLLKPSSSHAFLNKEVEDKAAVQVHSRLPAITGHHPAVTLVRQVEEETSHKFRKGTLLGQIFAKLIRAIPDARLTNHKYHSNTRCY